MLLRQDDVLEHAREKHNLHIEFIYEQQAGFSIDFVTGGVCISFSGREIVDSSGVNLRYLDDKLHEMKREIDQRSISINGHPVLYFNSRAICGSCGKRVEEPDVQPSMRIPFCLSRYWLIPCRKI